MQQKEQTPKMKSFPVALKEFLCPEMDLATFRAHFAKLTPQDRIELREGLEKNGYSLTGS